MIELKRTEQQRDLMLESTESTSRAVHRRHTDPTSCLIIGNQVIFKSTKITTEGKRIIIKFSEVYAFSIIACDGSREEVKRAPSKLVLA